MNMLDVCHWSAKGSLYEFDKNKSGITVSNACFSTAQAADYSIVSSYEGERTQMTLLDTTFMSTIEDELAQSGFKVFKNKH